MKSLFGSTLKRHFNSSRLTYEIPDEYHNSFYLANASLLQIVNYFVHSAYKVIFPELVEKVAEHWSCTHEDAAFRVRTCIQQLEKCEAQVDGHFLLRRYHGDTSVVRINRAYHGVRFFDKCLGGLRFNANLNRHNSQGFAAQQTYRNALFGIEMGGAAGGIKQCPFVLDTNEMREILGQYISRIPKFNNLTDLMEPDLGSSAIEMDILKTHQALARHVEFLGKTHENGGLKDHLKANAKCVVQATKRFLENEKISGTAETCPGLEGKTYILQGLGKIGKEIALLLHREGAQCIGVREHDCLLYEPAGIHVKALFKHIAKFGTMRSFTPKCREYDLNSIFTQSCDILILAAVERSISCAIADKIQAKVLVEVANLPISPTAYRILTKRNKLIIPGLLTGSGTSLMSYYEHCANVQDSKLDPENVPLLFNAALQTAVGDVIDIEAKLGLQFDFLQAAYIRGIRNIFKKIMGHELMQVKSNQTLFEIA